MIFLEKSCLEICKTHCCSYIFAENTKRMTYETYEKSH